jgi:protein-disulfide isomerase
MIIEGMFWEMHDTLFENQDALDEADLIRYAMALGLDPSRFERDMDDPAVIGHIREDVYSGIQSGVSGTPTFFINGIRHDGSYDLDTLLAAIQDAMAS